MPNEFTLLSTSRESPEYIAPVCYCLWHPRRLPGSPVPNDLRLVSTSRDPPEYIAPVCDCLWHPRRLPGSPVPNDLRLVSTSRDPPEYIAPVCDCLLSDELPFMLYSHAFTVKPAIAQSVERLAVNQEVGGSSPLRRNIFVLFTPQCLLFTPQRLLFTPQRLLFTPQCLLFTPQRLLFTPHWGLGVGPMGIRGLDPCLVRDITEFVVRIVSPFPLILQFSIPMSDSNNAYL